MKELRFRVEGMSCGGCERSVNEALGALEGVATVDASAADGEVRVTLVAGAELSEASVSAALAPRGFGLQGDG